MAGNKGSTKGVQARYAAYQATGAYAVNRKKKLVRALKRDPNNQQIVAAMSTIGKYSRKTPNSSNWNHTSKAYASSKKYFNSAGVVVKKLNEKKMFTLGQCAHDSSGALVWNR